MKKNKLFTTAVTALFLLTGSLPLKAQCAMCRAVLESGSEQAAAEGINNGILYLMVIPYVLVGVIGFIIYRKMKS